MHTQQSRNLLRSLCLSALLGTPALMAPGAAAACGTETCDPPPPPPPTETTCTTIKKDVSPDGLKPWYDANSEAEAVALSSASKFRLTLLNCGSEPLVNVHISDPQIGVDTYLVGTRPGSEWVFEYPAGDFCKDKYGLVMNTATVNGIGETSATPVSSSDVAWVNCGEKPPMGGEGCTPGYWKQTQHFDSWPSAYGTSTTFSSAFGRDIAIRLDKQTITNPTLLQALMAQGGNINAAARHAVAALLNSASTGVSYDLSASEVIALFQANYPDGELDEMKNQLAKYNEQGCPLN